MVGVRSEFGFFGILDLFFNDGVFRVGCRVFFIFFVLYCDFYILGYKGI